MPFSVFGTFLFWAFSVFFFSVDEDLGEVDVRLRAAFLIATALPFRFFFFAPLLRR